MASKTKKRARQQKLPGTDRKDRDSELERLIEKYLEVADERAQTKRLEDKAHGELLAAMQRKGLERYNSDDEKLLVEVQPKSFKLRISKVKAEEATAA